MRERRRPAGWKDMGRRVRLRVTCQTRGGKTFAAGDVVFVVRSWKGAYSLLAPSGNQINKIPRRDVVFLDAENTEAAYDEKSKKSGWPRSSATAAAAAAAHDGKP